MLLSSASSGAKIILTGEHAVVYGYPAIAIPFNGVLTTVNIFKTSEEITISSKFFNGFLKDSGETIVGLKELIIYLLNEFNQPFFGLHFEVVSNIESQRGMGSSAALAVAATKALYQAFNQELSDKELISNAMYAENFFHKNASGLDVHTIVYQQPIWYIKNREFEKINIKLTTKLVIIDTGLSSKTRDAVSLVANRLNSEEFVINNILNKIGEISINAKNALINNDFDNLIKLLSNNQSYLKELGVSNQVLDQNILKAQELGLKGVKLTGGGLGGCIIGITNDLLVITKIKSNFSNVWVDNLGENNEN